VDTDTCDLGRNYVPNINGVITAFHSNFTDSTLKVDFVSILVADESEPVYYVSSE
jgi:hypothetical protein